MQIATEKYRSTDISGNYADFAKALGGYGERVTEPGEIVPAIKRGIEQDARGHAGAAGVHHREGRRLLDVRVSTPLQTETGPMRRLSLLSGGDARVAALGAPGAADAQDKPRHGGELIFVVPSEPPTYDGHAEGTFGVVHPLAPHYNTLLRIDPFDKTGSKPVADVAESWTVSRDGLTYTLKLRQGVKFHDGSVMTSRDVKASYDRIVNPPAGVTSYRKGSYRAVEAVEAPDAAHDPLPAEVAGGVVPHHAGLALQLDHTRPISWPRTSSGTPRT